MSSAYQLALDVIKQRYRPADWNIYPFHFSDGDNYYSDNEEAVKLADELIATCNLFGYGEIGEEGSSSYRRSSGALFRSSTIACRTRIGSWVCVSTIRKTSIQH